MDRPDTGTVEQRTAAVDVDGRRIRGLIPYGIESRDLGGWTEIIEPTAFQSTNLDELRAVVDHAGVPLGRYPRTLDVEDRDDGLHWSLDPPASRADVVEAIERGDMRAGSWRMVVSRDRWEGDVRHVEAISELRDVTIVGAQDPAYGNAAPIEYRSTNGGERRQEGAEMDPQNPGAETAETETTETETRTEQAEAETRSAPEPSPAGSLQVEDRTSAPMRGLADEFRAAGFPGEAAEVPWQRYEDRAVTWSPSVNMLNQVDRQGGPFPFDERYAWSAIERVPVDSATTSVLVLSQTVGYTQDTVTGVVRDIDATTEKAEIGSTINLVTVPLKGVAGVQSGIPNIVLEQPPINSIIERDLTAAINDGLDGLVVDTFAASGHQAPSTDNVLVSIRKCLTTLYAAGYSPDSVILTPAAAEAIDVMTTGVLGESSAAADADFVFGAARFAPGELFGLRRFVSRSIPSVTVLDSRAYGKLYASPVRLAAFEENSGRTNSQTIRCETGAAMGVERQSAAVRIAAS